MHDPDCELPLSEVQLRWSLPINGRLAGLSVCEDLEEQHQLLLSLDHNSTLRVEYLFLALFLVFLVVALVIMTKKDGLLEVFDPLDLLAVLELLILLNKSEEFLVEVRVPDAHFEVWALALAHIQLEGLAGRLLKEVLDKLTLPLLFCLLKALDDGFYLGCGRTLVLPHIMLRVFGGWCGDPQLLSRKLIQVCRGRQVFFHRNIWVDEYVLFLFGVDLLLRALVFLGLQISALVGAPGSRGLYLGLSLNDPLRMHEDPLVLNHDIDVPKVHIWVPGVNQGQLEALDPKLGALTKGLVQVHRGFGQLCPWFGVVHGELQFSLVHVLEEVW